MATFTKRDLATSHLARIVHYDKCIHTLQSCVVAHWLIKGRESFVLFLQSLNSNCFAVNIHRTAIIGKCVLIGLATGMVIGEKVTVNNFMSVSRKAILDGIGKNVGDHHLKVGGGVTISAGAKVPTYIKFSARAYSFGGSVAWKPNKSFSLLVRILKRFWKSPISCWNHAILDRRSPIRSRRCRCGKSVSMFALKSHSYGNPVVEVPNHLISPRLCLVTPPRRFFVVISTWNKLSFF